MTTYWKSLKLNDGKICSDHDGSEWQIGEWREFPADQLQTCVGLNACPLIVDAMGYVAMEVLAEVETDGRMIESDDKVTCERMRILRAWKWQKKDSVALAVFAAELCLQNFEKEFPDDKSPREAIEAAKAWIVDPTESAAWSAESAARSAWSAAWSAARSAWSAAWSAARSAWSAARSAESAARSAESAAESAARSAWSAARSAESAAESAARSAWSAAWSAARSAWSAARSAESARRSLKEQIQKWIIDRLPELEEILGEVLQ